MPDVVFTVDQARSMRDHFIDFHVDVIKDGMATYGVSTNPILMPGNVERRYSEFVTFIGGGVEHDSNTQFHNDATVAYRNACLNAVEYLHDDIRPSASGPVSKDRGNCAVSS